MMGSRATPPRLAAKPWSCCGRGLARPVFVTLGPGWELGGEALATGQARLQASQQPAGPPTQFCLASPRVQLDAGYGWPREHQLVRGPVPGPSFTEYSKVRQRGWWTVELNGCTLGWLAHCPSSNKQGLGELTRVGLWDSGRPLSHHGSH